MFGDFTTLCMKALITYSLEMAQIVTPRNLWIKYNVHPITQSDEIPQKITL